MDWREQEGDMVEEKQNSDDNGTLKAATYILTNCTIIIVKPKLFFCEVNGS